MLTTNMLKVVAIWYDVWALFRSSTGGGGGVIDNLSHIDEFNQQE